jgi:hypothetical protein
MLFLLTAIVGLTAATGYIHFWVGGTMLLLNAVGYFTLAAMVILSAVLYRRALPLVLVALAGYTTVTILAWIAIGPYFDVAYLAKAIEIALIASIAVQLWITRDELQESLRWGRSLLRRA